MKNLARLFSVFPLLLVIACQKDLKTDFLQHPDRLTLYGVFYAQDSIQQNDSSWYMPTSELMIAKSAKAFSAEWPSLLKDAKVSLYENGVHISDFMTPRTDTINDSILVPREGYRVRSGFYSGNTYKISATHAKLGEASAQFYLPYPPEILWVHFDTTTYILSFALRDTPGADFYSFSVTIRQTGPGTSYGGAPFIPDDPNIVEFPSYHHLDSFLIPIRDDLDETISQGYLSDQHFDGQVKKISLQIKDVEIKKMSDAEIVLFIRQLTPAYYDYQKSLAAYLRTENNPFAEKVQLRSNVENGYGMVGGMVFSSKVAIKK